MSDPRTVRFGDEVDGLLVDHADNLGVQPGVVIKAAVEQYLGYRSRPDQMHVPEVGPEALTSEDVVRGPSDRSAHEAPRDRLSPVPYEGPAPVSSPRSLVDEQYGESHAPRLRQDGSLETGRIKIRSGPAPRCICVKSRFDEPSGPTDVRCKRCGLVI